MKGLIPEGGRRPSIGTSWGLATKNEESYDVNNQLNQMILRLKDKIDILKKIREEYKIEMVFAVVIEVENNETPGVHFEIETLKFITDIGAEIDIDIYVYS